MLENQNNNNIRILLIVCWMFWINQLHATITKTIGATGDYTSITAAWAAIPGIESPITQPWILEIKSDYSAGSETFPVNLTTISGASATNTITIRPQSGVTAFTTTSATVVGAVIKLNGCSYVTIDGRAGGAGSVIWSIENTSSTNGTGVVNFTGSATYNTVKYCTLLNGGAAGYGCVNFITTGGNNSNTVNNCNLTKSSGGTATTNYGVRIYSGTADNITISNNNVYDFTITGISNGESGGGSGTAWSITGNSIYNTSASYALANALLGIDLGASTATGNATITGNYIGGRQASCGGSAMTLTANNANYYFRGIVVQSNAASVTISSNTIQNISYTQSVANATNSLRAISYSGSSNFSVGSSGNGNTIGSTTGTGSISITGTFREIITCIVDAGTGTNSIAYNSIGGISQASVAGALYGIAVSGVSTTTVDNNIIGNTTASNMTSSSDAACIGVYCASTGTYTVTNNTIQNYSLTSNTTNTIFAAVYNSTTGTLNFQNNTIRTIYYNGTSSSNAIIWIAGGSGHTVSGNTVTALSYTSSITSFWAMSIASTSTTNTITIQNNNIGSATTANDIDIPSTSGTTLYGIVCSGTASYTISGNNIRNIRTSGGSNAHTFYGMYFSGTGATNTINSDSVVSVTCSGTFYGIRIETTATVTCNGNVIGRNSASNIYLDKLSTHYGIYFSNSTGGAYTASNNYIQGITLDNLGSPTFYGIATYTGGVPTNSTINCQSNTIRTISMATGVFKGIYFSSSYASSSNTISSNSLSDLSVGTTQFFGIQYNVNNTNITLTCNSNTIGSSTANNISSSSNSSHYGIYFPNATGGTYNCTGNTIQNFNLTSNGTSNIFYGFDIEGGIANLTSNTISTITSVSKNTASTGALCINGIYLATGGHTLNLNTINTLKSTSTGGAYSICGINSNNGSGTNAIKKTKITGLDVASTTATSICTGILLQGAGSSNSYNNVILLNNGATSSGNSIVLTGIHNISTGTTVIYHNTSKIYGTASSNSGNSAAYYNGAANTVNIRNNIFQNVRTNSGGTGKHYAIQYATNPSSVVAEDYNFLEASGTGGYMGYYAGDQTTLGNWQGASGTGTVDYTASLNINALGKSTNGTTSDIVHTGTNLFATVADDYEATARATPNPCRGAFECPVELPISLLFFDAKYIKNNGTVHLNWATVSEHNNDFFTVEKTTDGKYYEVVEIIDGSGNSYSLKNYETFDIRPSSGLSYYRLKQTDFNGDFAYSDLETIYIDTDRAFVVTVYPNPSSLEDVIVTVRLKEKKEIIIELTDELGTIIRTDSIEPTNEYIYLLHEKIPEYRGVLFCKVKVGEDQSLSKIIIH